MWFSPRWVTADPFLSYSNHICQEKFASNVLTPPVRTYEIWNDLGDIAKTSSTKKAANTYSGTKVTDGQTTDYLSNRQSSDAENSWN